MQDTMLIGLCLDYAEGLRAQEALDGNDPTWELRDAISAAIGPKMSTIIATRVVTLGGCRAKATLFQKIDRDDLAASLARDVIALLYRAQARTRKSFGSMTRKLSVTSSHQVAQFAGTRSRKKVSVAMLKSLNEA